MNAVIHSREAIDEKFVDKYLYDEDTIDYQMTKIYHESAHNRKRTFKIFVCKHQRWIYKDKYLSLYSQGDK